VPGRCARRGRRPGRDHVLARAQRRQPDRDRTGHGDYNASQDRVGRHPQNQGGYSRPSTSTSSPGQSEPPDVVMFPEYMVQQAIDSGSVIPVEACIEAVGVRPVDSSSRRPSRLLSGWSRLGDAVQRLEPGPLLQQVHVRSGRPRPRRPPSRSRSCASTRSSHRRLRRRRHTASRSTPGADSGGGWFLEQWFANAGELYADNGNGRLAPATGCCTTVRPASSCSRTCSS
jgi:sn-glycerol 3-phosphate transport system substrate-binding protein